MPPTKHARLSASSAHRWMNCAGSIRMSQGIKDIETIYQIEGRAAHTFGEQALRGEKLLDHVWVDTEDGKKEFPVDDVMREAIGLYVDTVRELHARLGGTLYIERTFDLGIIGPPEPMFGTADVAIVGDEWIDIVDLKYGSGVVVEVIDNVQLFYYALGAILAEFTRRIMDSSSPVMVEEDETILHAACRLFKRVRITIVQPRAPHTDGPVRSSLEFTGADVEAFAERLMERARATQAADAPLTAGSWCQFCPARGHCPELARHAQLVAQTDFESVPMEAPPDVEHMPIEQVAKMLGSVKVLEIFVRSLYERVQRELEAGAVVPGWKMVMKRAQRVWADPEELKTWAKATGLKPRDLMKEPELKSPAQIEAMIGKRNLPEELYARISSGLTLVSEDDPRPAVAVGPAEDFAQLPPTTSEEA